MSDQDKFRRMLEILMLLSNTHGASVPNLAKRFNISPRSVYRYIKTFKDVGFAVKKQGKRYKVETEDAEFEDISELLFFSEEESYMLSEVIHNLDEEPQKKQRLKEKLTALFNSSMIAANLVSKREVKKIKDLFTAVDEKIQVVLKNYRYSGALEVQDIVVEPFKLTEDLKHLWAFNITSKENILYKISRISSIETKSTPWQHENEHQAGFTDVFNSYDFSQQRRVVFELDQDALHELQEKYPLAVQKTKRIHTEKSKFDGKVANFEGVGKFVLSMADHISVISPKEFKRYLKSKVRRITEK